MKKRRFLAFSLVEMLVVFVVLSVITASVAPIVTKKLTAQTITLKSESMGFSTDCTDEWSADCKLCNKTQCTLCVKSCPSGQYAKTTTCECVPCEGEYPFCAQCSDRECKKCKSGYGIDTKGACSECQAGSYSLGDTPCQKCPAGKYQDEAAKDFCKNCEVGYAQNQAGMDSCYICPAGEYSDAEGLDNCNDCEEDWACTGGSNHTQCALEKGSYAKKSYCENCPANCADCTVPDKCIKCASTHYLTSEKLCDSCPLETYCDGTSAKKACSSIHEKCSACNASGCSTCKDGFIPKNGTCAVPCASTQYYDGSGCKSCSSKFTGCSTCDENGCKSCNGGYYLNGNVCTSCSSFGAGCSRCSAYGCTDCHSGYYLSGGLLSLRKPMYEL